MALYLGSKKQNVRIGSVLYSSHFYSTIVSMINGITLLTSDNYILKDTNGLYLTAKEGE